MKKLHLAFGITALAILTVGLVHSGIAFIVAEVTWDPLATSFPTWAAFVLPLLFYMIASVIILLAWLITWLIVSNIRKKDCPNRSDVI